MARKDIFFEDDAAPKRGTRWIITSAAAVVLGVFLSWFIYAQFRIDVETGEMAVLIHKTGLDLPNSAETAPSEEHKGVQREVLTEGRYFRNPYEWDWQVLEQTSIPDGKLGVLVSLTGEDLPYGEFLARRDEQGNVITKGIVRDVLKPGRYPINPYLFTIEMHEPVTVPAGFQGVVTNLAGPLPNDPNVLLVESGERGTQKAALAPGTYYVNPYVTRVNLVDCRSQRFDLAQNRDMGFPSLDGFWVNLDGVIEFRVVPEKAPEIFVIYNEIDDGDQLAEEIVRKVIMPNARSFCRLEGATKLGREFIGTRADFQTEFQEAMSAQCEPLGIEIVQALITNIYPPEQVRTLVEDRSLAERTRDQYTREIEEQKIKEQLAVETEMVNQKRSLIEIEEQIVRVVVLAEQEQAVALTEANKKLEVSRLRLEASKDEAAAILARGKAEADVIGFQNEADAAGWKRAVEAFSGDGGAYARYVLLQKMAPSYQRMMVNTADSPIMSIFESFAPPDADPVRPTPLRPDAVMETDAAARGEAID